MGRYETRYACYGEVPLLMQLKTRQIYYPPLPYILIPWGNPSDPVIPTRLVGMYEKWFADPDVTRHLARIPPNSRELVEQTISDHISAYFSIFPDSRSGPIGHIGISNIDYGARSFWRGQVIGDKSYWNTGVASNVGGMLMRRMAELGFRVGRACASQGNIASLHVLRKHFGEGTLNDDGQVYFEYKFRT